MMAADASRLGASRKGSGALTRGRARAPALSGHRLKIDRAGTGAAGEAEEVLLRACGFLPFCVLMTLLTTRFFSLTSKSSFRLEGAPQPESQPFRVYVWSSLSL